MITRKDHASTFESKLTSMVFEIAELKLLKGMWLSQVKPAG